MILPDSDDIKGIFTLDNAIINIISEAKLIDIEDLFLSIGSNSYFAFNFNVDNKYKWVEVCVENMNVGRKHRILENYQ